MSLESDAFAAQNPAKQDSYSYTGQHGEFAVRAVWCCAGGQGKGHSCPVGRTI
ncbi:hypothetical protein NSB25_26890 [Acetatifactor muris]|uniref:hypothetical protein n=1 Tax=Acetatifactor muris TaxID=879566 RepID=UPI001558E8EC|nr:hypothetical protein [Acetatifactor muris]MCR2050859.1 hypothetical protein [Acetatifactor muris]